MRTGGLAINEFEGAVIQAAMRDAGRSDRHFERRVTKQGPGPDDEDRVS